MKKVDSGKSFFKKFEIFTICAICQLIIEFYYYQTGNKL